MLYNALSLFISKDKLIKPQLKQLDIFLNEKIFNIFPVNKNFKNCIKDILNDKESIKYQFKLNKFTFLKPS